MSRHAVLVAAALLSGAAFAEEAPRFSVIGSNGMRYDMDVNDDGFVLISRYPLVREVAPPGIMEEGIEVIYAGKDCDAFSPVLGHGTWWFGNGGFVVDLEKGGVGFPRMEPGYFAPACQR